VKTNIETHALSHSHLRQTSESTVESDTAAAGANSSTQSTLETHAVSAAEYAFEEVKRREAHPTTGEDVVVKDWTATESAGTLRGYELDRAPQHHGQHGRAPRDGDGHERRVRVRAAPCERPKVSRAAAPPPLRA
jgi:hypothetical protein